MSDAEQNATAEEQNDIVVDSNGELSQEQIDNLAREGKVELRFDNRTFLFKIPDFEELTLVEEALPILDTTPHEQQAEEDPQRAVEFLAADPIARKRFFARVNKLLCVCSIKPRLTNEDEPPTDEGDDGSFMWVRWLRATDRASMFACLMGLSGYTKEAGIELRPFSRGTTNEPWIRLQSGTENSQVKSSPPEEQQD